MILVLGHSGQLGSTLLGLSPAARGIGRRELDLAICSREQVHDLIKAHRPEAVVNCAAYNAVDAAETDRATAFAVNANAVGWLAEASVANGAGFVTFSTDFVFDGRGKRPYVETDPTGPLSAYGESKLAGERLALAVDGPVLVIRTAWVAAPGHQNFITRVIDRARAGQTAQVVDDQTGSPTFAPDLARATLEAVASGLRGLVHVVNRGQATRYELARAALSQAGLDPELVIPIATNQLMLAAVRPAYSVLGTERRELSPLPDWQVALAAMIDRQPPL